MPGPLPKKVENRQHRIKKTSRATLVDDAAPITKAPQLPDNPSGEDWHDMTVQFWQDLWLSPMTSEYIRADIHGLLRLLVLVDMFWRKPTVSLSGEIRLMGQLFGLSPIDRRRLEWQVVNSEDAKDKHNQRRGRQATTIDSSDPRLILTQ